MGIDPARRTTGAALALGLIVGCTSGPDFRAPAPDAPSQWSDDARAANPDASPRGSATPLDAGRWWRALDDPLLDALIDEALSQNIDLQQAGLRIASARTQRAAAGGAAWPQVAGTAVAGR